MREEELWDQLQELDGELKSFPAEAHWFCPKRFDGDFIDYDQPNEPEEGISQETKKELIQDYKKRFKVAYRYSQILGINEDVTGQVREVYSASLDRLLMNCDKCALNWHQGRKDHLKWLSEQYDDDVVAELSKRINTLDFQRIDKGLSAGQVLLQGVEPQKRNQSLLAKQDTAALMAIYESLCCVDYHKDNARLSKHFDYVFEQVQQRKVLRLGDTLPAMARFLFSQNHYRQRFATNSWEKMTQKITGKTFDWVVQDVLGEAMVHVADLRVAPEDIVRFWQSFLLMLERMDQDIITHRLRGMEVQPDIYHLALQHLAASSGTIVQLVISALQALLVKAPKVFWSSMEAISASAVVDCIFQSPGFERLLLNPVHFEKAGDSPPIAWIPTFLYSIGTDHRYDACRALLRHLLERFQAKRYSDEVRLACCHAGIAALNITLETFVSSDYKINPSTSLIVISELMGLVEKHRVMIAGCADLEDINMTDQQKQLKSLGMLVVKNTLTLDCKSVRAEFDNLQHEKPVQRGMRSHSQPIWQGVLDIFRPGSIELAKSIIPATSVLAGLDQFHPKDRKKIQAMPEDRVQFNKDLDALMDNISRIIDRLSDFSSSDLGQFSQDPLMIQPLVATLLSCDQSVCEATVGAIKAMTGEDVRQDAIQNLLETSFSPVLASLNATVKEITRVRTFGPVPYMIRINGEVLTALAGNTGVLRARSTFTKAERYLIKDWWGSQWRALHSSFGATEVWSPSVNKSTAEMQDFCRAVMEYAEALFDEYTVFASALKTATPSPNDTEDVERHVSSRDSIRETLAVVGNNINGMVTWLRLRDGYLVSIITKLLSKLLRALGDYNVDVHTYADKYIRSACMPDKDATSVRTNLTMQQKAELQRALDDLNGFSEIVEVSKPPSAPKNQGSLDSWSRSAGGMQHEPRLPARTENKSVKSSAVSTFQPLSKHSVKTAMSVEAQEDFREKRRKVEEERARAKAEAIAKARAIRAPATIRGEGSGLKGIGGVAGKDHAPIRSEIMVGSSDEDSDDDDEDETNALVTRRKETSKVVSEYEESKRRALKLLNQGPVKKTKVQRSAKDLRARVEPNMNPLYLEILNWEIFHDSDTPPSGEDCRKIDNKYLDLDLYKTTFAPLLISEVWRSLVTARDENNYKPIEIKVLNRMSVDMFMEVSTNMPISKNRDLMVSERDIVLISPSPDPMNNPSVPHCLARVQRTTRKKDVLEVTYSISRGTKATLLNSFVPNSKVFAVKIADMTTTQREYAALSALEFYDLCSEVLEAKPSPIQKYSDEKISSYSSTYKLNRGQAQAILSANENDGFTLIQGPPGSGKTKTIVAMVGCLLTQSLKEQAAQSAHHKLPTPGQPTANPTMKKKLLICAPSNAAVDELVVRLMEGIQPLNGPRQKINVIRIGRSDAINAAVKEVMLDELVKKKLEGDDGAKSKLLIERDKLHTDAGQIKERLNVIRPLMDEAHKENDSQKELQLRREFDDLKRKQASIGAKMDEDKQSGNTFTRQNEINRRRFQQEVIDGAHVLCSTLSGSGHDMFRNINVEFDTVIIDEAAQCIELSALIPLKYGATKCILVGDPEQLPPTVLSRSAKNFGYEQSLFVRMQKNHPKDVHLLDTQYRMHPEISSFPSEQFYNSKLIDGPNMDKLRKQPWHASTILGPYRFFDVEGIQTKQTQGHSFINVPELNAALALYARLKADYRNVDFRGKIGIITSYKAQLNEMKIRFAREYGDAIFEEIEFNTTDAFQGREREIIIFSCVRAKATGGIGFLGDIRRMNVGLTRAKSSLWVLGDSRSLQQGQFWNRLIEDAKARKRYTTGNVMELFSRPTARGGQPAWQPRNPPPTETRPTSSYGTGPSPTDGNFPTRPKVEDESKDVDMMDAPDPSNSRKSSVAENVNTVVNSSNRPQGLLGIKPGIRKPAPPGNSTEGNHAKRPRESDIKDEQGPSKKAYTTPPPAESSIEAALREQQAKKSTNGTRPRPTGLVPPPRRPKPAADPFIQRKPPKRS
ncbi:related to SEN1 protein [Rhynchosporium secalis]|uniref:Related to SEN1 protein n=1 Tax=Rhynchosporium secalis TaxID=38038 RepID=A0A1E1MFA3_RHYSE|nr:related to SEN1 protein [Rhynchosporium secalis]